MFKHKFCILNVENGNRRLYLVRKVLPGSLNIPTNFLTVYKFSRSYAKALLGINQRRPTLQLNLGDYPSFRLAAPPRQSHSTTPMVFHQPGCNKGHCVQYYTAWEWPQFMWTFSWFKRDEFIMISGIDLVTVCNEVNENAGTEVVTKL